MKRLWRRVRWKEGQQRAKSEGITKEGRGQDKLEGRVNDEIESREGRTKVSTW